MSVRPSASFTAGALTAALLVGVPAAIAAVDANPDIYDGTAPAFTVRPLEFRIGESVDAAAPFDFEDGCGSPAWNNSIPTRLTWSASDPTSGIAGYDVYRAGAAIGVELRASYGPGTTSHDLSSTNYRGDCGGGATTDFATWAVAKDVRGNTSSSTAVLNGVRAFDEQGRDPIFEGDLTTTRTGLWSASTCVCFNNGQTLRTSAAGATMTFQVNTDRPGQTVALIMAKASNRGRAEIRVDGGSLAVVDTIASTPQNRVIVWQRVIPSPGAHTLTIRNLATSGRPRIDVDGVLLTLQGVRLAPQVSDLIQE